MTENVQVILVTHRFEEIPGSIDRILCMKGGTIYQQAGRDEQGDPEFRKWGTTR